MKALWKRGAVVAGVLVLVCAAIFFNDRYQEKQAGKMLGQATLVDGTQSGLQEDSEEERIVSDYFASARLTRQQARDNAISILEKGQQQEGIEDGESAQMAESIETLANFALSEAQIESMITAKGYADCVVFLSSDSVSVVVSAQEDGLQTEDVAKITDIVKSETGLSADRIKILEVN